MSTDRSPWEATDTEEFSDPPGFEPGTAFGRYTVTRKLAAGGMGAVYEAMHGDLQKRVALKTLHPEIARDPVMRQRFLQEGRAASSIRHPHVVDVSDFGVEGATAYLVMEYLEGESLASRMQREGAMDPAAVVDVLIPVIAAVSAAHAEAVVHRDLKPENIFLALTRDGMVVPKVLDFGISKVADAKRVHSRTASSALLGTPHYMSPEQTQGAKNVDARSDQYSLGVILYECVTGRLPFDGESLYALMHAIVSAPVAPPSAHASALPQGFEAIVVRAMERDPERRFASVRDLGRELLTFAGPETRLVWDRVFGASSLVPAAPPVAAPARPSSAAYGDTLQPGTNPILPPPAKRPRVSALRVVVLDAAALVLTVVAWSLLHRGPTLPAGAAPDRIAVDAAPMTVAHHVDGGIATVAAAVDGGPRGMVPPSPAVVARPLRPSTSPRAPRSQAPRVGVNGAPVLE